MAGDIGKRFAGPTLISATTAAGANTLFTVDTDHRAHIIHIHAYNGNSGDTNLSLSIGVATTAGNRFFDAITIPTKKWLYKTGLIVLEAGELIQAYASVTNVINIIISGVEVPVG